MRGAPVRWIALAAIGLFLVVVAVGAPSEGTGDPLDPDGTGPAGARALVLLLGELGAEVDVVRGSPPDAADTAVVLRDDLGAADETAILRWVEAGGVLVLADAFSSVSSDAVPGPCPAALDAVDEIEVRSGSDVGREGAPGSCFADEVRAVDVGAGTIVVVSDAALFTNELLDEADNAVLAAALLAPTPGTEVAFVDGPSVEATGDTELFDLVSSPVRQSLAEAGVAVALWVLWRARRLGRPVSEEQPVSVAGSELVAAVGRLLDARRRPDEAAAALRADVRRAVDIRLGLPPTTDLQAAAAAVASRTGMDEGRAAAALGGRPVATDADFLEVAADLDRIRTDLLGRTT